MLKTDYKNDVFTGQKKYTMTANEDNTYSFTDVTSYSQVGDKFETSDLNEINKVINLLSNGFELTQSLSQTNLTDFVFTSSDIHSDSEIQVRAFVKNSPEGEEQKNYHYSEIYTTEGQCTVTFPQYPGTLSLTVQLFIR